MAKEPGKARQQDPGGAATARKRTTRQSARLGAGRFGRKLKHSSQNT